MLSKIIHFSIKHKLIIGLMTLALIIWGSWSAGKLPVDAVPDIMHIPTILTTNPVMLTTPF
jgi:cobalt-zinc-cadmium resistance protein CzcA